MSHILKRKCYPRDDAQLQRFRTRILAKPGTVAEADVTGWDWSVQEWELAFEAELRNALCGGSDWLLRIFQNREHCVANAVYSLPDGRLVDKLVPGVQCSGRFNTSSTNSRLRVLVAFLVGSDWAVAMGDDCLEDSVENAKQLYAELGHPLKMYNKVEQDFEFCSLVFTELSAYPVDGTKTLYNILEQGEVTEELMAQFHLEMRNHPRWKEFEKVVRESRMGQGAKLPKEYFADGSQTQT